MALIKCNECGGTISDKAVKCPHCGSPLVIENSVSSDNEATEHISMENNNARDTPSERVNEAVVNTSAKKRFNLKLFGGIVLSIILVGASCFFIFNNNKNELDYILDDYEECITEMIALVPQGAMGNEKAKQEIDVISKRALKLQKQFADYEPKTAEQKERCKEIANKLVEAIISATESSIEEAAADSCAVDTVAVDEAEALENITLYGSMTDVNGTYPIELSFEKNEDVLTNCIYTNVKLGGKIKMNGEITNDNFIFTGKDGNNSFRIDINRNTLDGYAQDGNKRLDVSLGYDKNEIQNTSQQGPSWLQGTWIYNFAEDRRLEVGELVSSEITIKGNKLKIKDKIKGPEDYFYEYDGTWQYKDQGEGYFIYYLDNGGRGIDIDLNKKALIAPITRYENVDGENRRMRRYMEKIN